MNKPSVGRLVHYTLSTVDSPKGCGRVRPALITSVSGCNVDEASMQVYTEGGRDDLTLVHMKFDVQRSDEPKPGFWHWPPFVAPKGTKEHVLPPEGKMHLPSPSYVALGTAETWDGKKDSAENPFTLRTEAEVAAAPPVFSPDAFEGKIPPGMPQQSSDGMVPTPTQREPHFVAEPPPGFSMEIPPPAATKPSLGRAPDGLPFATDEKKE